MRNWMLVGCAGLCPALAMAQGFGAVKTAVTLERRLPAAVRMPGNSFSVRVTGNTTSPLSGMVATKLQNMVETDLVQGNGQLTPSPSGEIAITVHVLTCSAISTPEYAPQFGKNAGRGQPVGYKVAAELSVTYEARNAAAGLADAEPLTVKYNHEFNGAKSAVSGLLGKGAKEEQEPHTQDELLQVLAERMAERIAARLVNTNEKVEVLLGKGGGLDDANRYATAGQWTKYVETLETMTPFAKPADDAYREYNIGVGDEALGYKADSASSAQKYFEKAVIQYRKAGEMNPHEKYFIQPVNRIEVALEHYKALSQPVKTAPAPGAPVEPPAPAAPPAPSAGRGVPPTGGPPPGAAQKPSRWQVTEIINGVPVIWIMMANGDASMQATMGDAQVAKGTWRYDAAKRSFHVSADNLVLRQPFTCDFVVDARQSNVMNGFCTDQMGNKYKTDAVRQ